MNVGINSLFFFNEYQLYLEGILEENLFKSDLNFWPVYVTKKPTKSIYDNIFYLGDAFYTFVPALAQGASQSIEAAYELFNLLSDNKKIYKIFILRKG